MVLLMGGIYELLRSDGLKCLDIHAKFHTDRFSHSKVSRGIHTQTNKVIS
jgi:hypothetical protein